MNEARRESNLAKDVRRLPHKAARLLEHLGVAGQEWSRERSRGPNNGVTKPSSGGRTSQPTGSELSSLKKCEAFATRGIDCSALLGGQALAYLARLAHRGGATARPATPPDC